MIKYLTLIGNDLKEETIDKVYVDLLNSKATFGVIRVDDESYILTKEKSFFKVENLEEFINEANRDIYFKTVVCDGKEYLEEDLNLYYKYLNKYKKQMMTKYGDKYLFGSIAIKTTNNNIITTIRGKENFDEFTVVTGVDYNNKIVYVSGKKATLNAPLLYNLLKNNNIKIIVHINHKYDDELSFVPYAFPGTVKDSFRNIEESFNISHHGLFMLFDNEGKMVRGED